MHPNVVMVETPTLPPMQAKTIDSRRRQATVAVAQRRLCDLSSPHSTQVVQIDRIDLDYLKPTGWLSDRLIELKMTMLASTFFESGYLPSDVTFISCVSWLNWRVSGRYPLDTGITKANPLLSRFIAIPCNVNDNHWILTIVVYASDLIDMELSANAGHNGRTTVLYFDSLAALSTEEERNKVHGLFQNLLHHLAKDFPSSQSTDRISNLRAHYPKVRQSSKCLPRF